MDRETDPGTTVTLHLSPALYATIQRVASRAGKPLPSTIVSLLWIACGQLQLGPWRKHRPDRR
ncbi:hypothetical protein ES703_60929 [subsurface metagenome]